MISPEDRKTAQRQERLMERWVAARHKLLGFVGVCLVLAFQVVPLWLFVVWAVLRGATWHAKMYTSGLWPDRDVLIDVAMCWLVTPLLVLGLSWVLNDWRESHGVPTMMGYLSTQWQAAEHVRVSTISDDVIIPGGTS